MANPEQDQEKERQRVAAQEWLETHWTHSDGACPMCGTKQWSIGDVAEVRLFTGGGLMVGGGVYPVVPVMCDHCGNTLFVNAIRSGVVPQEPPKSAEEAPAPEPVENKA